MTTMIEGANDGTSGWKKLFLRMKAFDEAFDYDPVQYSADQLNRRESELEDTVRNLESRLAAQSASLSPAD
jgi:hypothetical protein